MAVQLKYDGFRAMAYIHQGQGELISRKGNDYKSLDRCLPQLATFGHDVILDGEITVVDGMARRRIKVLNLNYSQSGSE